jgi:putative sterol carrier protein
MRWPFRRILLWRVFATMERSFRPERARGLEAVVHYLIRRPRGGGDRYEVVIGGGACRVSRRVQQEPNVSLELDGPDFLKLMTGNAGGPGLLLRGRLRVGGSLTLALRLPRLFRIPRPRPEPEEDPEATEEY